MVAPVSTVQNTVSVGNRFGDEPVNPTSVYSPEITNEPPRPPSTIYSTQRPMPVYTTTQAPLPSGYIPVAPLSPSPQRPFPSQPAPLPPYPPTYRPMIETQQTTKRVVSLLIFVS